MDGRPGEIGSRRRKSVIRLRWCEWQCQISTSGLVERYQRRWPVNRERASLVTRRPECLSNEIKGRKGIKIAR